MPHGPAMDGALRAGRGLWRAIAPDALRRLAQPLVLKVAEARVAAALKAPEPPPVPGPLIVSGLLAESKGVSEAARLTLAGLRSAGLAPIAHDLRETFSAGAGARSRLPASQPGGVWIAHVNAPEALIAMSYLEPDAWRGRRRIGYWAWELPRVPALWVRAANAFDEIWTPSAFCAGALAASGVRRPIRVMPHPVALDVAPAQPDRDGFAIDRDALCVLAAGDLASSAARKNLAGAIAIYVRAFPQPTPAAVLVLKIQPGATQARFQREVGPMIAARPDIRLIADTLPGLRMRALIASADILLSPHRAEGFGLALAEAMLMGVPALATGWSGNLDFMRATPDLLIDHRLVPVRDSYGVYREHGQSWAEPDIADGAAKLRHLAGSADLRGRLAGQGAAAIRAQLAAWGAPSLALAGVTQLVERQTGE